MTTPADPSAAPPWLRDLVAARIHCEERWGWPVGVELHERRLILRVSRVIGAITMPAMLGAHVRDELAIAMLDAPVLTDTAGAWWTFLTAPASTPRLTVPAELRARKVHPIPVGGFVIIPNPPTVSATSQWITQPRPTRPLPPWSTIIGATSRVVAAPYSAPGPTSTRLAHDPASDGRRRG
jgi:hypothetical protein